MEQEQPPSVQILITMTPDGNVNVAGPIDNKLVCYGLLEVAKEVVRDYHVQKAQGPRIQPVSLAEIPDLAARLRRG